MIVPGEFARFLEVDALDEDICSLAYSLRRSQQLDQVSWHSGSAGRNEVWSDVRHYVGRLGSWTKAAKVLVKIARSEPSLVDDCTTKQFGLPRPVPAPLADGLTSLDKALVRMLPASAKADRLPNLQACLENYPVDISSQFYDEYTSKTFQPREHAEVAMLEHFYQGNRLHFKDIPYIGCSKPSCYCCDLYLRHHPGQYLVRPTHGNVWISWKPPLLSL